MTPVMHRVSVGDERMRLLQIVISLEFEEVKVTHPLSQKVYMALGGTTERPELGRTSGTSLQVKNEKQVINWNANGCLTAMENVSDPGHCVSTYLHRPWDSSIKQRL